MYVAQKVQTKNISDICNIVKDISKDNLEETFAIRARSFTKNISYKQTEIEVGSEVLKLNQKLIFY